jgi:hypothetical protein
MAKAVENEEWRLYECSRHINSDAGGKAVLLCDHIACFFSNQIGLQRLKRALKATGGMTSKPESPF